MIDEKMLIERFIKLKGCDSLANMFVSDVIKEIKKQPKIGEWIPCSERMPENEQSVEITFIRTHPRTGEKLYLTARAFHEDGTMREEDSYYQWEAEVYWDYDTEKECYLVPEGWYEDVYFAESFEKIREEQVIAWRSLTEPYHDTFEGGEEECKKS